MAGSLVTLEELGSFPAPPPARPRVLIVGAVLGAAASVMVFAGLLGLYLSERRATIAAGETWLPSGVSIPLTPGNMGLLGLGISAVTMQWAVYSIARDDRRHAAMALGVTLVMGVAHLNLMGFYYSSMGFAVATPQGALVYALTGAHLAMLGVGMLFTALMAFRTLGGRYSSKDPEGIVAAAVYWYAQIAVYAVLWYAIFVTK